MKLVINKCHGGFGISRLALHRLRDMGNQFALDEIDIGENFHDSNHIRDAFLDSFCRDIPRDDTQLIEIIEKMGKNASAKYADLQIIEIPDGVEWQIEEYDGWEWVAEKHMTWGEE